MDRRTKTKSGGGSIMKPSKELVNAECQHLVATHTPLQLIKRFFHAYKNKPKGSNSKRSYTNLLLAISREQESIKQKAEAKQFKRSVTARTYIKHMQETL